MGGENQSDFDLEQYKKAFDNFDKFVDEINSENLSDETHRGYLINFTDFNKLKKKVKKFNNKNDITCSLSKEKTKFKLKPENYEDLEQKIGNGDEFIIINGALQQIICDQEEEENLDTHQIEYSISPKYIKIILKNGRELKFKNNKDNIIGKGKSSSNLTNNNDINTNTEKIYKDIINYFKFTTEFSEKINNKNKEINEYKGFLVNKEWVDKWKNYSYYNKIKEKYLKNDNKNKIIEKIREDKKNSSLNYNEVNDIERFIIEDINQLKENLNNSFEILNEKFLRSFNKNNIKPFDFLITYRHVEIKYQDEACFSFETSNNVITIDNNIITLISNRMKSNKIQVQKKDKSDKQNNLDNNLDTENGENSINKKEKNNTLKPYSKYVIYTPLQKNFKGRFFIL